MRNLKKGIVLLLLVAFTASIVLAGCGSTGASKQAEPGKVEETKKAEEPKKAEESKKAEEKTELTFASFANDTDPIKAAYDLAIKNFNANNKFNVEIKASYTTGEQYKTQLATQMAANNAPDMLNCWPAGRMAPYVEAKRLYPISDLMDKDPEWKGRYKDNVFSLTTFDGKVYGVPQFQGTAVIYYNKDMFAKFGLKAPATWSELMNAIAVLKKNGKEGFALDAKEPWVGAMYGAYIADRVDPEAFKSVQKEPKWLIPAYIETGKKIGELVKAGAFPKGATGLDYVQARNLFDTEKAGMYIMGTWDVGYFANLKDDVPVKGKVGVCKFPAIEGGKGNIDTFLTTYEAIISISTNCKKPEVAGAFLKYMASDEIAKEQIAEKGGYFSTVKVNPDPSKVSPLYIETQKLLDESKSSFGFYDNQLGDVIGNEFNNAIQALVVGKTPEEAFAKVEAAAKKEMKK